VAVELFLSKGFEETTLAEITAAAGVSKTSFFRYFPSKASIVWWRFDEYTAGLARLLEESREREDATMDLVRAAVVGAVERVVDDQGMWMQRFRVLDESTELRSGESQQWAQWRDHVASFVAHRHGLSTLGVPPQAVAGAVHAAYLSVLRSWLGVERPGAHLLPDLDRDLRPLCAVLQGWLDTPSTTG
jgi:TetR/AcrR family transcriptional regulator, regulator of mycofactocin system